MMATSSFTGVRVASKARQATATINTVVQARRTKAAVSSPTSAWYGAFLYREFRDRERGWVAGPAAAVLSASGNRRPSPAPPLISLSLAGEDRPKYLGPYSGATPDYLTGEVRLGLSSRRADIAPRPAPPVPSPASVLSLFRGGCARRAPASAFARSLGWTKARVPHVSPPFSPSPSSLPLLFHFSSRDLVASAARSVLPVPPAPSPLSRVSHRSLTLSSPLSGAHPTPSPSTRVTTGGTPPASPPTRRPSPSTARSS